MPICQIRPLKKLHVFSCMMYTVTVQIYVTGACLTSHNLHKQNSDRKMSLGNKRFLDICVTLSTGNHIETKYLHIQDHQFCILYVVS